jgi:hypothetical protein
LPVRATEAECQTTIIETARLAGWKVAAFRPAQTRHGWRTAVQGDGAGWPDLALFHPATRRTMFVELKRHPYKLQPEQAAWGETLIACGHIWRVVYVPDELDQFCQELVDLARASRVS